MLSSSTSVLLLTAFLGALYEAGMSTVREERNAAAVSRSCPLAPSRLLTRG